MIKIMLDPGHYDDRDNRIEGYSEARTMLQIAKKLKAYGETNYEMRIDLTRTDGQALAQNYGADLRARGEKSAGYHLFLSLHSDAAPNPDTRGATLYGSIRPDRADPTLFAKLSGAVEAATGVPANRVRYRADSEPYDYVVYPAPRAGYTDYYGVLRHARAKLSCLLELGFHTNPKERALLSDESTRGNIAQKLTDAMAHHFGLHAKRDTAGFIADILPEVLTSARNNALLPSLILAQAILESGAGTSELAQKARNLFGMKASPPWTGETYGYKGENYRFYPHWSASIRDHGAFFTSTEARKIRYRAVIGETDRKRVAVAIGNSGYAGDPLYGQKIQRVMEDYGLGQYDAILAQTEKCPCRWSISLLKTIGKHREVKK